MKVMKTKIKEEEKRVKKMKVLVRKEQKVKGYG